MSAGKQISRKPDVPLFGITLLLMGLGVVMVYSSSSAIASERFASSAFFFKRHAVRLALALGVMLALRWIDYHALLRGGRVFMAIGLGLLALAVVPNLGLSAGEVRGASRAIRFASLSLQPAEAVRLAFLIYLASTLSRRQIEIGDAKRFLAPPLVILAIIVGLLLAQPDLGTALATMAVVFGVLFIAGARLGPLALSAGFGAVGGGLLAVASPYRLERIHTFFDFLRGKPDVLGSGWHINQSLIGLGSGGWWGVGFGESRQKFFFLPDPHTDSIFSVIGEELGFVGAAVVLLLFLLFVWRGVRIALRAPDLPGLLLAGGITISVFVYFAINVAVTMSLLPATGLPMPFVSYGGSSLIFNAAGVGILLNISQQMTRARARSSGHKRRPSRRRGRSAR
jgi:cell division protein FtsW